MRNSWWLADRALVRISVVCCFAMLARCASLKPGTDRADASVSDSTHTDVPTMRDSAETTTAVDVIDVATMDRPDVIDVQPDVFIPPDVVIDIPMVSTIDPPTPIAPISGASLSNPAALIRWQLSATAQAAMIELCSDRQCSSPLAQPVLATVGSQSTRLSNLSGVVFWRLRGWSDGQISSQTSATWEFTVDPPATPTDSVTPSLLDINHDGLDDVLVGEPTAMNAAVVTGGAQLFLGQTASPGINATPSNGFFILGTAADGAGQMGTSSSIAGDLDGDGFGDVVVGAPCAPEVSGTCGTGNVSIAFGGASAFALFQSASGAGAGDQFGASVSGGGDFNGDGRADVIVGAPMASAGAGQITVIRARTDRSLITATYAPSPPNGRVLRNFGAAVANVGDVDGDGLDDFVIGAPGSTNRYNNATGIAYVLFGNEGWTDARAPVFSSIRIEPTSLGSNSFGMSVAAMGDLNHDGFADFAVGRPTDSGGYGGFDVYYGGTALRTSMPTPIATGVQSENHHGLGASMTGGSDVDNDGYDDLVISALDPDTGHGVIYLYLGPPPAGSSWAPYMSMSISNGDGQYGAAVSLVGDVNGDGLGDLVVGAPAMGVSSIANVGGVFFFANGGGMIPAVPTLTLEPSTTTSPARFGTSVSDRWNWLLGGTFRHG